MDTVEKLEALYQEYAAFANSLPQISPVKKLLQGGHSESERHPAHRAFYDAVEAWVKSFAAGESEQEARVKALEVLLFAAADYKKKPPYWYMIAAQRHALALIPGLEEEKRAYLAERYRMCYPFNTQLPVQQEVEKLLRGSRAKGIWGMVFGK